MKFTDCFLLLAKIVSGLSFTAMCHMVNAITITFDDIDPSSVPDGILTTEFESKGFVFQHSAYLIGYSPKSLPNYVVGPGFQFDFVGELPTYVSFYTGSSTGYKVSIGAIGPNGYFQHELTEGAAHGMGDPESTPYIPNQFVVFKSDTGISSIQLGGQSDAYMDDLSFYYAGEAVPEPSSAVIIMLGMLCALWRHMNLRTMLLKKIRCIARVKLNAR